MLGGPIQKNYFNFLGGEVKKTTLYKDPGYSGLILGLAGLEPLHVLPAALLELRQVGHVYRPGHSDQARAGGDWLAGKVGGRGWWGLGHCPF